MTTNDMTIYSPPLAKRQYDIVQHDMIPERTREMPAKQKSSRTASSVSDFKKKAGPVELPSGHYMVIRKKGLQALVKSGQIPNELLSIVQSAIDKGTPGVEDEVMKSVSADQAKMDAMIALMYNTVCFCAVEPRVLPVPKSENERDEEQLYVDELEEEDLVFIFQYVTGGTADVAGFRGELAGIMATVPGREDMALSSQ